MENLPDTSGGDGVALSERAAALERQATDVGEARKALESAALISSGYWIGFVSLSAYLAVTVGVTTHRSLLLEDPLKLPILGVEVPLVTFFWLSPTLYLLLHAYLLLHLKSTAEKIREWESLVGIALDGVDDYRRENIKNKLKLQLSNSFIMDMIVASSSGHRRFIALILQLAIVFTVFAGPLLVLLLIQLQFLPYHSEPVTWVHRLTIAADILLLLLLWPLVLGPAKSRWRTLAWFGPAGAILGFSVFIATFPGERLYQANGPVGAVTAFLFERGINDITYSGPLSNVLVLPDEDFVDHDQDALTRVEKTRSFRDRHLERAVLVDTGLQQADFTDAKMQGVNLTGARLQGASFDGADLREASLMRAQLEGASLERAELEGAGLTLARLQGVSFNDANLEGADLTKAQVIGVSLNRANLSSASMVSTKCQGILLWESSLQEAETNGTECTESLLGEADIDFDADSGMSAPRGSVTYPVDRPGWDSRVSFLKDLACSEAGHPHVANRLIVTGNAHEEFNATGPLVGLGEYRAAFARHMLDPQKCPGAAGVSAAAKTRLEEWASEVPEFELPASRPSAVRENETDPASARASQQ